MLAADRVAGEWLFLALGGPIGHEPDDDLSRGSGVDEGCAEPEGEADRLVQGITGESLEAIVGGGYWSTSISHRRDVDDIADSCYDLIYLALATLRGEPAPEHYAKT
jgi:hypothetical protein